MDIGNFSFGSSGNASEAGNDIAAFGQPANFLAPGTATVDGSGDGGELRDSNGNRFDPAEHSGPDKFNADGSYRRKRGRKSGSAPANSGSKRASGNKAGIEALTRALAIVHLGIASATKTPELALEDSEAETLAGAVNNVMVEFDFQPDPKAQAIFGLVVAAGAVYGPRVYMIRERKKGEKKSNGKGSN